MNDTGLVRDLDPGSLTSNAKSYPQTNEPYVFRFVHKKKTGNFDDKPKYAYIGAYQTILSIANLCYGFTALWVFNVIYIFFN